MKLRKIGMASVLAGGLFCLASVSVICQTRVYRGSIGGSHIEMRLDISGNKITGTYSYDRVGEDLKLSGQFDDQGRLQLSELGPKNKPAAKIACKYSLDDSVDSECSWSRLDGSREAFVTLAEQHVSFTNGLQVSPKTIIDRTTKTTVSYPQITNAGKPLGPGAQNFNGAALASVRKAIKDFEPEAGRTVYEANYNVLLATNDLISVEFAEYTDGGGAHPNNRFWALTYDLTGNKELKLDDLFKPDSDYKTLIAKYVVSDINKRAIALEKADAQRSGRKAEPREEPLVSEEQLSEPADWAMTPKGLMVYFDFPHVMAYFDRSFVPYSVVKGNFRPEGPAARIQ